MASVVDSHEAPTSGSADEDLDPAAFLKSVRELSEKRDREDAERYRKLEEEVERGRQARAARRAERAKSISPEKPIVLPTSPASLTSNVNKIASPPPMTPPASSSTAMDPARSESPTKDIPEFKGFGSGSISKASTPSAQSPAQTPDPSASAAKPAASATSLARSGTLSWQQRPSGRVGGGRPLSMVSTSSSIQGRSTPIEGSEPSRDQIAASLGARDPSWFKQTADRGIGNAAFRRNKEDAGSIESFASGRRGLPGLSREVSTEPARESSPTPSESVYSDTTSRAGSVRGSTVSGSAFSTNRTSTSSKPDLKSLLAADQEQEKAAPISRGTSSVTDGEQSSLNRTLSMSSSQARLGNATERPASPTKGAGGFVQSAMLKRSDSVNKRWSAQPGPSVSRETSLRSTRSGYGGLTGSHSMPKLEPKPDSREGSSEISSRPTSSSSNLTNLTLTQGQDGNDVFAKPTLPSNSRPKSVISTYNTTADEGHVSPPTSPSKRWSPTKSSWLESAITKPESPKPAPAALNSQPSWMADLAKAKAQRASAESTTMPADSEREGSRPSSPTKPLFGQGMLKKSESRDLSTPRTGTPKPADEALSRSSSPTKKMFGENSLKRSESADLAPTTVARATDITSTDKGSTESTAQSEERSLPGATTLDQGTKIAAFTPPSKANKVPFAANSPRAPAEKPSTLIKSPPPSTTAKIKPDTPPKPPTDFRSNLRARAPSEAKEQEQPEFLSKFGNLKRTQTQNYVAPDVLKSNILRGKSDLAKTDGPVKTQRRDELKESLLARKDQWKKEKEEGIVHERKVSGPPLTPQKPEALAKRELLGRPEIAKVPMSPEKPKTATPEALARHKSLKQKSQPEPGLPSLEKQTSAPVEPSIRGAEPKKQSSTPIGYASEPEARQATETSKMARFNPGLASVLARGPPAATSSSKSDSPAFLARSDSSAMTPPSEPPAAGAQLQDMRKGRAKGPKRRKGDVKGVESEPSTSTAPQSTAEPAATSSQPGTEPQKSTFETTRETATPVQKAKPRAPPGSAASVMMASLQKSSTPAQPPVEAEKPSIPVQRPPEFAGTTTNSKPSTPVQSPFVSGAKSYESKPIAPPKSPAVLSVATPSQSNTTDVPPNRDVPEFKGFGSMKKPSPAIRMVDENKENAGDGSPSVKSVASTWGRQSPAKQAPPPTQIQLPSKKDEEAAMRSAGLLASSSSRPSSSNGLGISVEKCNASTITPPMSATIPPKPAKSSRSVSGQLRDASPNKGSAQPRSETERQLADVFGSIPRSNAALSIDTPGVIAISPHQERVFRTIRKSVYSCSQDGSQKQLPPHEEYTFFDESVYMCNHSYSVADGPKKAEIFIWTGDSSSVPAYEQAQSSAKKLSKETGNAPVSTIRQGFEPPGFLQALGGMLVTRRGSRERASKQYMLCGRKHLGQIVFDEVDFAVDTLCSGFAYLISYPVSLQETKLYLWKGSACSSEELSAARLAAMDLSETGEIIEVDDGAEFSSFLKIFGPGTTKASISKPTQLWRQKALAPSQWATRLFRIQQADAKSGLFTSIFTRRPSWNNKSPARSQDGEIKAEAIEISPFMQTDLEADCVYLLDAHSELYVLVGPVFASQPEVLRNILLGQVLLFASEYSVLAASTEDRSAVPTAFVLTSGVPLDMKALFRHWDDSNGLWGTGGLMAGSQASINDGIHILGLDEVLEVVRNV